MANQDKKTTDAPFNFGNSPLIQQTEQNLVNGFQRIENEKKGRGDASLEPLKSITAPAAQQEEETKGIQAYIPMSLYERLVMRKLKTKEPLGSMFLQAIRLWIDVQEGTIKIVKGE